MDNNVSMNTVMIVGGKTYEKLSDVVLSKGIMMDIKKLSPHHQTSSLESYHSVMNHFAPQQLAFFYTETCYRYIASMIIKYL